MVHPALSLLTLMPEQSARIMALRYLEEAAQACKRLTNPEDDEALHDFRVGLRRLRSSLRAFKDSLMQAVPKKFAKKLKEIASATGTGRDSEVQILWLEDVRHDLRPRDLEGWSWLLRQLDAQKQGAYAELRSSIKQQFDELYPAFHKRLSIYRAEINLAQLPSGKRFGSLLSQQIHELLDVLGHQLASVHTMADEETAHQARITGKRLRYLLEPVKDADDVIKKTVKRIKELQELLGQFNDAYVLTQILQERILGASNEQAQDHLRMALTHGTLAANGYAPADLLTGLYGIAKLVHERRQELFAKLRQRWFAGQGAQDIADWREAADFLDSAARGDGLSVWPAAA